MKAAILGTGFIARVHAEAIKRLGHEVALVVDTNEASAKAFADAFDCHQTATSLSDESLKNIDVVHVCTPPAHHFDQVSLCLKNRKHVFCEKPLCLNSLEAEKLAALADESGCVCCVDFDFRFFPAVTQLKNSLKDSGSLQFIRGHYEQEFHILPGIWSWRYEDPYRALTEIGTHILDLIQYISGESIQSVCALLKTVNSERVLSGNMQYAALPGEGNITVTNEDAACILLNLSGGAIASVFLSEVSPGKTNDCCLSFTTDTASFSWSAEHPNSLLTGARGIGLTTKTDAFSGGYPDTFTDAFTAFYEAICTGTTNERLASFHDGAKIVSIIEKTSESAKSCRFISII